MMRKKWKAKTESLSKSQRKGYVFSSLKAYSHTLTRYSIKQEHRPGNTLEKDISNLDLKKFDQEFVVDPLFRKTSADFDEGGARGLLLNHLSISPLGQIIFDADDSTMLRDANVNVSASQKTVDMDKLMGIDF
jgi:hypothetical protein